jgi:uncharacterized membrane protein
MMYLTLKLLHILFVVAFLGNITTGIFWKAYADRTRETRIIEHTMAGIIASDKWFTIPGVIGILVMGFSAAVVGGIPFLRTGWLFWSLLLFVIAGVAFVARIAPLQRRMLAVARAGRESGKFDTTLYRELSRSWEFWGMVALVTPLAVAVLMVLKPQLPGLG